MSAAKDSKRAVFFKKRPRQAFQVRRRMDSKQPIDDAFIALKNMDKCLIDTKEKIYHLTLFFRAWNRLVLCLPRQAF